MKKIGLLSDTHGFLDPSIFKHFDACDEIWHAGDFGEGVAEQLANFKPLRGVYGNIDGKEIRNTFPENLFFTCENVSVLMTHIGGYPNKYHPRIKNELYTKQPQLFISGHSHILKVMFDPKINCLHINPGAAGNQGWHTTKTLVRFHISDEKIHTLEVIEIGTK